MARWRDKRIVTVISNVTEAYTLSRSRIIKGGKTENFEIPLMIEDYRKHMGGVDLFDQRIQYHSYPHKCKKWWRYYFHFLLEIALNNSFIIFNDIRASNGMKKVKFLEFRLSIITELVGWSNQLESISERMEVDEETNIKHQIIFYIIRT